MLTAFVSASSISAEDGTSAAIAPGPTQPAYPVPVMETLVVNGRSDSQIGIAQSAAQGSTGKADIEDRPMLRPAELLETVPGMIATAHSGDGKANQYFLRGFDLDHGTDFATKVDGIPVNLPGNAHGQGYCDLNFLIPEIVERVDYRKGPYYAQDGDFASAGSADIHYVDSLPGTTGSITVGSYGYERGLAMGSPRLASGNLVYAVEAEHNDGPWENPDNFRKLNGVLRYVHGDSGNGYSITASAYNATWNSTNQMPERAIDGGLIGLYGNLSPTDGGDSSRYAISGTYNVGEATDYTTVTVYAYAYHMDLWNDFTFFEYDPVYGDQFEQTDRRYVLGGSLAHTWDQPIGRVDNDLTLGLQTRNDIIPTIGLYDTYQRMRIATVRQDRVEEDSVGLYGDDTTTWTPWLRTIAGLRGDIYHFDVNSDNPVNSGQRTAEILSPKASVVFGPWDDTEYYINGGLGFHSNDARGVVEKVDPVTGAAVSPATPLVRSKGAEIGARTEAVPGLISTLGLFFLDLNSELVFDGDTGTTDASSARTRRIGLEFTNAIRPFPWLNCDADFAYTRARYQNPVDAEGGGTGRYIPNSIPYVATIGAEIQLPRHFYVGSHLRYFSHRPLNESDTAQSGVSFMWNARIGYRDPHWEAHVDLLNILDRTDADQSYYDQSQLRGESAPVDDVEIHPSDPFEVRGEASYTF